MIETGPLRPGDRGTWEVLARALIERVAEAARDRGADRYYWHTRQDNARARVLYDQVARFSGFIRYQYPLLRSGRTARKRPGRAAAARRWPGPRR